MGEETVEIYVALLDEGVPVWRPVQAVSRDDTYVICSKNADPDLEHWQFGEGEAVYCHMHTFSSGEQKLTAYAKAEQPAV